MEGGGGGIISSAEGESLVWGGRGCSPDIFFKFGGSATLFSTLGIRYVYEINIDLE